MPEEQKGFFGKIGDWAEQSARANREFLQRIDEQLPWEKAQDWYRRAPVGAVHVKEYKENDRRKMSDDIKKASTHGWEVETVGEQSGHINVGRTLTTTALTGGLRLFLGASRTKGFTIVRFTRMRDSTDRPEIPSVTEPDQRHEASGGDGEDILKQIEKLAELNRSGALTDEEFAQKKAELLARL
jgi:hypothetical protein